MEINKFICDMVPGDHVEGIYILKTAQPRTTAAGKPFLAASLADCSGSVEAKLWDYSGPLGTMDEGKPVRVQVAVSDYRGALQLIIERIALVTAEELTDADRDRLVPVAPIDRNDYFQGISELVDSISDADYRSICQALLRQYGDRLRSIPAGKSVHHSFLGGLLMHTGNMLRTADFLAQQYDDTINRSLLLAGTLLHDLAKTDEFTFSVLGLVTEYSVRGQLLGHLVMGAQYVADTARALGVSEEKSTLLQHMLLSHHGQPEFGAAVLPAIPEAELLSCIDSIDSRMEIYRTAMEETGAGGFSKRIFALDRRIYNHGTKD